MSANLMERICTELSGGMPRAVVSAWFSDAFVVSSQDQLLTLCVPVEYKRGVIEARFMPQLAAAMMSIFGVPYQVTLVPSPSAGPQPETGEEGRPVGRSGRHSFVFENFIVGKSNEMAYSAAKAAAEQPGAETNNPLFLYGGSGLGKTHLLYAILNRVRQDAPGARILVFSAEQFTNELVAAIQAKDTASFKERYRSADMLLIDDIQFIAGRDFSQEEFFNTFNVLRDNNKQIVLTSDRPPRELQKLEERLITRFEGGLSADIKPPEFETRMAIVQSKAQSLGVPLSNEVAEHLAQTITSNVRQLEGAVKKLLATHNLMGKPVDIGTAREAVADMIRENPGLNPTPQLILSEVSSFYKIDEKQITGPGRQAALVTARQTAMFLIREMTAMSLAQIGERVFSRDHTTVMHSINRVEERRKSDVHYDSDVKTIIENIRGV